ncbi:hypothetical protein WJX72_006854 [[Myrmecia] bisecta]|uniref:Integrase catalytic domain-containing protein n=1 Tax=[Myrmecia] bisecta TaxID=41462 RepID=A0AAW1P8N3_9CHLO
MDLVGPLPATEPDKFKYIVVAIDYLTKWVEAAPLKTKESREVAAFFKQDEIARHGCPEEVLTDQGGEFQGELDQLLADHKIEHRVSSAYHPQTNGLTERFNKTLVKALKKGITKSADQVHWDKQLPQVLLGYRAAVQASTKFSPFYLLYGRHPVLPGQLTLHPLEPEIDQPEDPQEAALALQKADSFDQLDQLYEEDHPNHPAARANIQAAQNQQRTAYKQKRAADQNAQQKTRKRKKTTSAADKGKAPQTEAVDTPPDTPTASRKRQATCKPTQPSAADETLAEMVQTGVYEAGDVEDHIGLEPGDYVLLRRPPHGRGKLGAETEGPYRFDYYSDPLHTVCVLSDAQKRQWKVNINECVRYIRRVTTRVGYKGDGVTDMEPYPTKFQLRASNYSNAQDRKAAGEV